MNHIQSDWIKQFPVKNFPPNKIILNPGTKSHQVYAITQGIVKMYDAGASGNCILLSLFTVGCIIPMPAALLKRTNNYTFETLDEVEVHVIPVKEFQNYLRQHPESMEEVLLTFLRAFLVLTEQVSALKLNVAEDKIGVVIRQLECKSKRANTHSLIQKLTQQEIANLAGVSRETVSRKLSKILKTL